MEAVSGHVVGRDGVVTMGVSPEAAAAAAARLHKVTGERLSEAPP